MRLGFRLFRELRAVAVVHEVFPSVSYWMLREDQSLKICLDFRQFHAGPKDMLDAYLAAVTVREFVQGRGEEVGGGDRLGAIVLPRPITGRREAVFVWPRKSALRKTSTVRRARLAGVIKEPR
jgi:hypothetical protein